MTKKAYRPLFRAKSRFRPLYKQFLKLRDNVQGRQKVLKLKKKKWKKQIFFFKGTFIRRFRKYKPRDQIQYSVSRFPYKWYSHKNSYKRTLDQSKRFRLFYGHLTKRKIKNYIYKVFKKNLINSEHLHYETLFLKLLESRLDTVLYKSKFSFSLRNSRQLILHEKIFVNNRIVKSPAFHLKSGDFITIKEDSKRLIALNILNSHRWPIPPKHLSINYNTTEIIFNGISEVKTFTNFPCAFKLDLETILINYRRH